MLLLLMIACGERAPFVPECVASGRTHTCSDLMPRMCTDMGFFDGLAVMFEEPVDAPYAVEMAWDGQSAAFGCEPETVDGQTAWMPVDNDDSSVWNCDGSGFSGGPRADEVVIAVTVEGEAPITTTVTPCWDVSEPNGRCCGFVYTATETIPAF